MNKAERPEKRIAKIFKPGIWLPVAAFAVIAYLVFGWLLVPLRVRTADMTPTFEQGELVFCCRPWYWLREPERHDLVVLRPPRGKGLLIRRVVALPGETVGFYKGKVVVNRKDLAQPYVEARGTWTLLPSKVPDGMVYAVGDNRSMPPKQTRFGLVDLKDVVGRPVW